MSKNLIIVESPAKAHTIEKYLGADFQVLASVGHIRKDTKVDKSTFDVTYEINPDHKKIVSELKKAVKTADKIWLATDEDREGEAISWHLVEVLELPKDTARITFHEITKSALENALKNPRQIHMDMVASQQARQTLDMLVGFDLSGVVRKKVPGAISAGRVQSPALRLVVEREAEIEKFKNQFNFKISGQFLTSNQSTLNANFDKPAPKTEAEATEILTKIGACDFAITNVEKTDGTKSAPVPLTTASLQIEANAKLGFSARTTMTAAQGLYQAGLITYHRTDSLSLSNQALASIANFIEKQFGKDYLKVKKFKTKSLGAQEAHEAIRPTNIIQEVAGKNDYEKRLYQLIRSRTIATQMTPAKVAKTTIKIADSEAKYPFSAKGEVVIFDGFLKVYGKSKDLELPVVKKGEKVTLDSVTARQTFTKPPARYTEGSLVKKLEELGIGRPSTYSSILTAIQSRGYCVKGDSDGEEREVIELTFKKQLSKNAIFSNIAKSIVSEKFGATKGKLLPTPIGELITGFLIDNFKNIVDYQFTANIEKELDLIAEAKLDRVKMLRDFYQVFGKDVTASEDAERYNSARLLGNDPETSKPIYAKIGKNGGFIQLGENEKTSGEKPRFAPLPENQTVKTVTLKQALDQLALPALPRPLGKAPDGTEIIAASGPFGPYLKAGKHNIPIKDFDPYTITLSSALPLYQAKIDTIIADWDDIMIIKGAYGPYIKGPGRRNHVKIPKDQDPAKITKQEAEKMLAEKPKTTRRAPRRSTSKKSTKTTKSKK